jgi:hypothetical protein
MKKFKDYITERSLDTQNAVDDASFNNDLSNPDTIVKINSYLAQLGKMEHLVPENALNKLKDKLGRLSISFEDVELTGKSDSYDLPLTQFGGRFGKDENGDINDDGISHKVEGGLKLQLKHEVTSGNTHFLMAQIV